MLSRARNYGVLACAFATALCISINTRTQAQGIQDSTGLNLPSSQTPTDTDHNTKLHIGVDRTDPHAFEPIYLVLTAERFLPDTTPQLMIAKGTGNYQAVTIPEKAWVKSEAPGAGEKPLQRLGTVLQMKTPSDTTRDYLFSSPGEYKLLVKMGPDSTTLTLNVRPPEIGEQEAWDQLGSKINNILDNQLDDQPEQATVDLCGDIIRRYPRSVCAQYCRAYLNISRFKLAFNQSGKTGGVAAYGAITADLAKDNDTFAGTFFGEMTGFYTCYTVGLTHKFDQLLKIAEAVKTHFTPYSDALGGMHMEVLQHMTPIVIPVDPGALPPATLPSAKP